MTDTGQSPYNKNKKGSRQIPELWSSWSEEEYARIVGSVLDGFGSDYSVYSSRHQLHYGREEAYDRSFHCQITECVDRYRDFRIGRWCWGSYLYPLNLTSVGVGVSGRD